MDLLVIVFFIATIWLIRKLAWNVEEGTNEQRELNPDGSIQLINTNQNCSGIRKPTLPLGKSISQSVQNICNEKDAHKTFETNPELSKKQAPDTELMRVLCCGIPSQLVDEAIRRHKWPAHLVDCIDEADVILSIRNGFSQNPTLRRLAKEAQIPIHVIKSSSLHQVNRALERLLIRRKQSSFEKRYVQPHLSNLDDDLAALEECRLALETIVVPLGKPVELLPRSQRVIEMQMDLIRHYRLNSDVLGRSDQQHLRVYPP